VTKTIVGYCEPFSVCAGETVELKLSAEQPGRCRLEVVRLICGDLSSRGPGLQEQVLPRPAGAAPSWPAELDVRHQPLRPGSDIVVDRAPWLDELRSFTLQVLVWPTRPGVGEQSLVSLTGPPGAGFALVLDETGRVQLRVGSDSVTAPHPLAGRRWYRLTATFDATFGQLALRQEPLPTRSPSEALLLHGGRAEALAEDLVGSRIGGGTLRFAGTFDGRLEAPLLLDVATGEPDELLRRRPGTGHARWDFATGIGTTAVHDSGPHGLHGRTRQSPDRAVTGSRWDGSVQRWQDAPEHYAAIHFHRDDLTDAAWRSDLALTVPDDLPSGLYAFRVTAADGEVQRTPFVVTPRPGGSRARLALLLPTATYWAYANHRMTISGAEFFPSRNRLRPAFQYVRDHPEVGLSMYEYHADGSGVMVSSRRRPILNLEPGADGWAFSADTNLIAYLTHFGEPFDVITDDDLHRQGRALLEHYPVVLTGSHPEYWSTAMLDALEQWLGDGGRLLYLGGNGFYWRVAWSEDEPWVMEVRRAEDGTRGWIAEPGEYYHAHGGEYGGLWRRLGRAPNLLVGVGFAAQGFDRASPYRRTEASTTGRAAWAFAGVEGEVIGDYGVGGGAAGQEIDRYDPRLGSPAHAVVLANSFDHSPQMLRTKEEFLATAVLPEDPNIRADVVFFEGPAGGAVFSVGSIAWYGALAHQDYRNDIARITGNVLRRFLDPEPFPPPPPASGS
jgi:N,N-dimethylformamidase